MYEKKPREELADKVIISLFCRLILLGYWTELVGMDWIYPTPGVGNLQGDQCKCVSRLPPLSWWAEQENIDSQRPSYSRAQLHTGPPLGRRVGSKTRKYRH